MRIAPHPLIYDWNHDAVGPRPPVAMLDDETLRDGLQSPSVRTPTIDQKIEILRHMDALGIDTADIGLPGAGPRVAEDVERLARTRSDQALRGAVKLCRNRRFEAPRLTKHVHVSSFHEAGT